MSAISAVPSMPILIASTCTSTISVRHCSRTKSTGTGCTPVTPCVLCAVNAVTTEVP